MDPVADGGGRVFGPVLVAVALLAPLTATGCAWFAPTPASELLTPTTAAGRLDEEHVTVTLYLRGGSSADAELVPVARELPMTEDLPRRTLELLIAGPLASEDHTLDPPLPPSTRVRAFRVESATAVVDLSGEVLTDATLVGTGPRLEALALASIANALTEFPAIEQVRLTIEGDGGDDHGTPANRFWGGWGLPTVLVRDETLIGPRSGREPFPELARFDAGPQAVGHGQVPPVEITKVKVRDRITYRRLVVELTDGQDSTRPAADVPRAVAQASEDAIVLEITPVAEVAVPLPTNTPKPVPALAGGTLELVLDARSDAARLVLTPGRGTVPPFYLHTQNDPTRIVLDVMK